MAYLIYSISFAFLIILTLLYITRNYWIHHMPALPSIPVTLPSFRYSAIPSTPSNFHSDAASGMHSSNFDLSSNIESGDGRAGLDERGKREVQKIMKSRGVTFDEARRMVMLNKFKKGGVGEDGIPRDPKFVSFS